MLLGNLFNTYKQYKDDTRKITEWLAVTSRLCGYDPTAADPVVKPAKLKGRARKLARDAAANATAKSNASAGGTYTVRTWEYVPMAESIAKSPHTKVALPVSILKTFKRCISARSETSKWYEIDPDIEEQATKEMKESNASHGYFTEILKKSLQVLLPLPQLVELDQKGFDVTKLDKSKADTGAANQFAHLEVQDIDDAEYEALADAAVTAKAATKAKFVPPELDVWSEWHFGLQCFMEDLDILQEKLKCLWEGYAEGEVDLTTASVTTNIAIEMVKRAEEDFHKLKKPNLKEMYRAESIPEIWFAECCIRDGVSTKDAYAREDKHFFCSLKAWSQVCESYLLLQRLVQVHSNGTMPNTRGRDRIFAFTRPAYLGTYNPELEWEDITVERQYEQVCALLNDMLTTLGTWIMIAQTPQDDMLLEGIAYIQENDVEPPMWLLFACQNFLNIHFALKTKSERPWEELRDFALSTRKTIKAHQAFMQEHPLPRMRSDADEEALADTLLDLEEWVLNDKIKQELEHLSQQGTGRKKRVWQDFELLRMSPVLCGMWKYTFCVQLQWKGISLLNDTGMLAAAHFYNCLYKNGYLHGETKTWEDMEYLLDLHREEDTFMGARPHSIEDCTKRLAMVQGVAPQTFARRRRGNNHRVLRSRAGSKFLSPSTPVAKILGQMYLQHQLHADWHLEQLDTIVQQKFKVLRKNYDRFTKYLDKAIGQIHDQAQDYDARVMALFSPISLSEEGMKNPKRIAWCYEPADTACRNAPAGAKWVGPVRKVMEKQPRGQYYAEMRELSKQIRAGGIEHLKGDTNKILAFLAAKREELDTKYADGFPKAKDMLNPEGLEQDIGSGLSEWIPFPTEAFESRELVLQWELNKSMPLHFFVDVVQDALSLEYLDIQFDYFAFFRSAMSLLLKIQEVLLPSLQSQLIEDSQIHERIAEPEGALCIVPQTAMLVACDPQKAPNLLIIRPWLEVDPRPLGLAAEIMRPWLEEHGDDYIWTEDNREATKLNNIRKAGPKVRFINDDADVSLPNSARLGYSSAVGIVEGMNAAEMREIYDAMRYDRPMGATVAETLNRLKGIELSEKDKENIRIRDQVLAESTPSNSFRA